MTTPETIEEVITRLKTNTGIYKFNTDAEKKLITELWATHNVVLAVDGTSPETPAPLPGEAYQLARSYLYVQQPEYATYPVRECDGTYYIAFKAGTHNALRPHYDLVRLDKGVGLVGYAGCMFANQAYTGEESDWCGIPSYLVDGVGTPVSNQVHNSELAVPVTIRYLLRTRRGMPLYALKPQEQATSSAACTHQRQRQQRQHQRQRQQQRQQQYDYVLRKACSDA